MLIQADFVIREFYEGACGKHVGAWALSKKCMRWGYYCPTIFQDVHLYIQKCSKCQMHAPISRKPLTELTSIQGFWSFPEWGINLVGPFSPTPRKNRFLVVAVDYYTKWVKAKQLATVRRKC